MTDLERSRAVLLAVVDEANGRDEAYNDAVNAGVVRLGERVGKAVAVAECKDAVRELLLTMRAAAQGPGPLLTALVGKT